MAVTVKVLEASADASDDATFPGLSSLVVVIVGHDDADGVQVEVATDVRVLRLVR